MAVSQAVLELLVTLKDEVSAGASSISSALGSIGTIAGGVALAGVVAFGSALIDGIGDAREAAQVMAQTQAVITSTGGAAGVTAQQVADMAGSLSAAAGKSLFGDSDIQKGQNLLLTFTNIKETLPETTQTMVDLAQAMGTDVSGGAIQLGKALNDPINGVSALSRVGVTFTDQQKEQIKTMQEAGDMAGAQRIILAELNKEFGGSAEAAAKADGGVAQFWDRVGEAKETLGAAVLPLLNVFVGILNDSVLPLVEQGAALFSDLVGGLTATGESTGFMADIMKVVGPIFSDIQAAASEVFGTLMEQGKPILDDLGAILLPALVAAGTVLAAAWSNVLKPALLVLWDIFKNILLPAIGEIVHILSIVLPPIINTVAAVFTDVLYPAIGGIVQALGWVVDKIEEVIGWFKQMGDQLANIQIPDWLQGHSPPPLANWFQDIGQAAGMVRDTTGDIALGSSVGALPALSAGVGGAGFGGGFGAGLTINLTVMGSVTTENDLVEKIRQLLIQKGILNLDIFGGVA